MEYLLSFLFAGAYCLLSQVVFDRTKLTPGHIVTISVILGSFLSFIGVYKYLLDIFPGGASVLILNYGNSLYSSGLEGLKNGNLLNALMSLMSKSSATLSFAIFMGFLCSLVRHHE